MLSTLAFGMPGGLEWIVVLIVALLLFGRRLPEVMRSLGKSVTSFKKGMADIEEEVQAASEEPEKAEKVDPKAIEKNGAEAKAESKTAKD